MALIICSIRGYAYNVEPAKQITQSVLGTRTIFGQQSQLRPHRSRLSEATTSSSVASIRLTHAMASVIEHRHYGHSHATFRRLLQVVICYRNQPCQESCRARGGLAGPRHKIA